MMNSKIDGLQYLGDLEFLYEMQRSVYLGVIYSSGRRVLTSSE